MTLLERVLATPRVQKLDNSHKRGRKPVKTEEEFVQWERVALSWAQGEVSLKQVCDAVKEPAGKVKLKLYYHLHRAVRMGHVKIEWMKGEGR